MNSNKTITNLRYYNDEQGILEVVFTGKYRSPYFRFEIRYPDGSKVCDHNKQWLRRWYPQITADILADPLN